MLSEIALLKKARSGDQSAFRLLVEQNEHVVRSTALGMLGDASSADDVAQEVFLKFYQTMSAFRGEAKLSSYLTRMTINRCLNEIQRQKRQKRWFSWAEDSTVQLAAVEDKAANPQNLDNQNTIQQALLQLEPEFRTVIVLRLIDGYSVKETAQLLDIPMGTVASRLTRGQKKLKTILEKWGVTIE
jgi:RNA polymerase sigma-70 factor (ECF subfamily)